MKYLRISAIIFPILILATSCARKGEAAMMTITSPVFENNQAIPAKYTCQGQDVNPPLNIAGIPEGTKSLVLIVDDPDAPGGMWVHWVVYNISPDTVRMAENSVPGQEGWNDFEQTRWGGPCPPSGKHRYFFKIYAVDTLLKARGRMTKKDVEPLLRGHILGQGQLVGLYQKS